MQRAISSKGGFVNVKVIGVGEVIDKIRRAGQDVKRGVEVEMVRNAAFIGEEVQASIMGERAEVKSVDTGAFVNSIQVDKIGENEFKIYPDGIPYGVFLEYGTSKMQPRRHFRNTEARVAPKVKENIQNAVNRAVN